MLQEYGTKLGQRLGKEALRQARMLKVMTESGVIRPYNPVALIGVAKAIIERGIGFAGGIEALAIRSPEDVALVDETGELTWKELDERTGA